VSSAASANNHFRKAAIFGTLKVAFGQTIQYVLDIRKETSIGLTRRPLMRSQAASAVRASAMPWPSTAASINMLALFRIGP
jgi:cobalamin biosynthesis protein CobD/CbiB